MEHPWWSFKLEKLKKKKKKLQRQLTPKLQESDPDEFKKTKNRWNNTRHILSRSILKGIENWKDRINSILSDPQNSEIFWKVVNNPIRKQKQSIPPLLDEDGDEQTDLRVKLKMFLNTYLSPPQPKQEVS